MSRNQKKIKISQHDLETLARCLFPDIQAYFQSERGKQEFESWKVNQQKVGRKNAEVKFEKR